MKKFNVLETLVNRDAFISTFWSVLQQMVVALSTYLIIEAIRQTTEGNVQSGIVYICAFTASLILVYVPNTLSVVYLQKWRLTSIESFVQAFIKRNYGKTSFGHARNKVKAESWLTNELFTVYDSATDLIYQIISTLMNSVFNIAVIAIAIDSRIFGWYLVAGILLVFSNYLFRYKIFKVAGDLQNSRRDLSTTMLSAWSNIFIGNRHNFENWNSGFQKNIDKSKRSASAYDLVRSLISSGTVVLALSVVALGNGIYIWENYGNISLVAAIFITLPRQIQIIQSIFSLFNLSLGWSGVSGQLASLGKIIDLHDESVASKSFIQIKEIEVFNQQRVSRYSDLDSAIERFSQESAGRFTLRGRNGAGKSTLLALLKELHGDSCFLLPTAYEDLSFDIDFLNHSDGNRLLAVFQKISTLDDIKIVILDEWDANLDSRNVSIIDSAIELLSINKVVIESRHRHG